MSDRRTFLTGLAASTVVPVAALAGQPGGDARLIELGQRFAVADGRLTEGQEKANAIARYCDENPPPKPEVMRITDYDRQAFRGLAKSEEEFHGACNSYYLERIRGGEPEREARRAEIVAAFRAWDRQCEKAQEEAGLNAADAACEPLFDEWYRLVAEIEKERPESIAGLAVKVRASALIKAQLTEYDDHRALERAVFADILAMSGGSEG